MSQDQIDLDNYMRLSFSESHLKYLEDTGRIDVAEFYIKKSIGFKYYQSGCRLDETKKAIATEFKKFLPWRWFRK